MRSLPSPAGWGGILRHRPGGAARLEQFVGRVTLAAVAVAAVLVAVEALVPGEEADAAWLATAAALIALARHVGFWPSVLVAFGAAAIIDVLVIEPAGSLPVGTPEDLAALLLFLVVTLFGASAVSRTAAGRPGATVARAAPALVEPLTEREREILALLLAGLTNAEIAERLVVSTNTVKTHLEHLYGKLGVATRLHAAARARELGLVEGRDHPKG